MPEPTLAFRNAVAHFWERRGRAIDAEDVAYAGRRAEVVGGKQLDGFLYALRQEIVAMPGNARLRYTISMPVDRHTPGRIADDMALNGWILSGRI